MVVVDEDKKTLLVVVPDDQLSLAIGRQGQNVRLASVLLGWRIDVKSEKRYAKMMEEGFQSLLQVEGINEKLAETLYDGGVTSAQELVEAAAATVTEFSGMSEEDVLALQEAAGSSLKAAAEDAVYDAPAEEPPSEANDGEASEEPIEEQE